MKNKKLIYFFAISLSIIFSLIYLLLFHYYIPSSEEVKSATLYLNQVGLYKEKANAEKMNLELQSDQITGYIYMKDDIYVVVCGVSADQKQTQKIEEQLKEHSYSYIDKVYQITDEEIVSLINANQYQDALELIGNQS